MKKSLVLLGILISSIAHTATEITQTTSCSNLGQNLWQPRPFSAYASREILMLQTLYDNYFKHDEWHGTLSTAIEYSSNFGNKCGCDSLGAMPFWSGSNVMTIGTNDGKSDLDAYQFGMGDVITPGSITITPKVQQIGTDLMLHFTRDKHARGLYFKIKAPLVTMMINPVVKENPAVLNNDPDQVWISYPSPTNRYSTLTEAFGAGGISVDEGTDVTTVAVGSGGGATVSSVLHRPLSLERGKLLPCKSTSTRIADLSLSLGYNVVGSEKGFFGLGIKGTCPTGTVPHGIYILEPIIGRAGHWGLGVEMTGHRKYWINEDQARGVDFWMQGELLHLFAGRTPNWRSFDLKQNGPGSKYMLLQFYFPSNPPVAPVNSSDNGRVPSFITQAVNITTIPIKTSYAIEGNLALNVEYYKKNWSVGLGLDVWGRTKEKLHLDTCNMLKEHTANFNDFAVLGRQASENSSINPIQELYYCEPLATINKSETRRTTSPTVYDDKIKDARLAANRIPANITEALDFAGGAEKRAVSGKVMLHGGYTWKQNKYSPNLTLFAGVEMSEYGNTRINFWSTGLQGSLNF